MVAKSPVGNYEGMQTISNNCIKKRDICGILWFRVPIYTWLHRRSSAVISRCRPDDRGARSIPRLMESWTLQRKFPWRCWMRLKILTWTFLGSWVESILYKKDIKHIWTTYLSVCWMFQLFVHRWLFASCKKSCRWAVSTDEYFSTLVFFLVETNTQTYSSPKKAQSFLLTIETNVCL